MRSSAFLVRPEVTARSIAPTFVRLPALFHNTAAQPLKNIGTAIQSRAYSQQLALIPEKELERIKWVRNIGISAHIDSGKTTLTERILYYTGKISQIHEVKGSDGVGATMDSMDLEREKGITIQSAATFAQWGQHFINIIDTPGHVDFTIEVERSLRVLDGAIMVMCGVSGVQSQTITVDRQMKRYNVPRLTFVNKLDRMGANAFRAIDQLRMKLGWNAAAVQIPIGAEELFNGVVDIIERRAIYFEGTKGNTLKTDSVPEKLAGLMEKKRRDLIAALAEFDPVIQDKFLADQEPTVQEIKDAIRRGTIGLMFTPVFMGSAFKNKGVQPLLDGVIDYLPHPGEVDNWGLNFDKNEEKTTLITDRSKPLVALAFKLQEGRYGQLTYMRIYQGLLKKGSNITSTTTKKHMKVPKLCRTHSDQIEEVAEIGAGEICAMFGINCSSGETFTDNNLNLGMSSMFVPEPVITLSVAPKDKGKESAFAKALQRFQREDPTFRVSLDAESSQTIIAGMGELHLEIYVERMRREYDCPVITGKPYVAYRETIGKKAQFDYLHKKQSGGAGQYARVIGYVEPLPLDYPKKFEFLNHVIGNNVPPNYIAACEKGFIEAALKGPLIECPVWGIRVVLTDGATHVVDSSELAFRIACGYALKQALERGVSSLLEPIMNVEISVPLETQGTIIGALTRRRGVITDSQSSFGYITINADVPLGEMFGYATELRSMTQGKGEFTMEYKIHERVPTGAMHGIVKEYQQAKAEKDKSK